MDNFTEPFASAGTLVNFQVYTATAGAGCTTPPVLSVKDNTTSALLASITLTNGTAAFDAAALGDILSSTIHAGDVLQVVISAADAGCTTAWTGVRYKVTFQQ